MQGQSVEGQLSLFGYQTKLTPTNVIAIKEQYDTISGSGAIDVGSVFLLRREVNRLLVKKGYAKLKGYKPRKQLVAILRTL